MTGLCVHPLMAVGLEGLFGLGTLSVVLAGMYQLDGVKGLSETPLRLEDPLDALAQLSGGNWVLSLSMLAAVLSIAFYNFFGISVTKELSAAHRMVMDCTRTVIVWLFSLSVHYASPSSGRGQPFSYVQVWALGRGARMPHCPHPRHRPSPRFAWLQPPSPPHPRSCHAPSSAPLCSGFSSSASPFSSSARWSTTGCSPLAHAPLADRGPSLGRLRCPRALETTRSS